MKAAHVSAAAAMLLLAGCMSLPQTLADQAARTPAQLRAAAADRNISIGCDSFEALVYGRYTHVHIVVDRGVLDAGSVSVTGAACDLLISTTPAPQP